MAYQDCDSFDHYTNISQRWELIVNTPTPILSSAYRRFAPPAGLPGQGAFFSNQVYARKNLLSNQPSLIVKTAFYLPNSLPASAGIVVILDNGTPQIQINVNSAGALEVWRAKNTTGATLLYTTGPSVISPRTWYGAETLFTVDHTVGAVSVWINGLLVLALTGINTQYSSNAYANQAQLGDISGPGWYFDDWRVWDTTGSHQNAPIGLGGDSYLVTKLANAPGAAANWTPNGAAANWMCTDDNPPDGDLTYVSGSAAGLVDAYGMPTAGLSAAPAMVVARGYVRKDDSSSRALSLGVSSAGAAGVGPSVPVNAAYTFADGCISLDPNGNIAWTAASADAAQHYKIQTA